MTFARGLASRVGFRTTNVAAALALAAAPALLRAQAAEPDPIARLDVGSRYAITLLIDSAIGQDQMRNSITVTES